MNGLYFIIKRGNFPSLTLKKTAFRRVEGSDSFSQWHVIYYWKQLSPPCNQPILYHVLKYDNVCTTMHFSNINETFFESIIKLLFAANVG